MSSRPLKVFLCHAHSDRDAVHALYTRLIKDGVDAWLDKAKLLPGQDWELEIRKAVRESDIVVVCLSKQFNQAGFRQKEVRLALDTAMEKPEGEIFIIPARLEECDTPESLRKWHWVDLFEPDGYEMLMRALRARAERIGAALQAQDGRQSFEIDAALSHPPEKTDPSSSSAPLGVGGSVSESVIVMGSGNVVNVGPKVETPPSPAQTPPSAQKTPPSASLPRDELLILYNDARALQAEGKLSEAAALYAKLGDYRDAPDRLRKLQLYLEADKWMKQGVADKEDRSQPWEEARARLEELLQLDPRFLDAPARLETARRWLALPETYDLLLDAIDREDWKQAWTLFEQIRRLKPAYRYTQPLFERTCLQMVQAGVTRIVAQDGKEMMYVPAGEFVMGSDRYGDEKPRHTVYLDAFYIDRYPVTNAEYKKFVEATKHRPPSHWQSGKIPPGRETHPVVNVSWDDAAAYAAWAGKRLPTEAEWEKAAGWDDIKREQRVYPWGDRFDSARCNSKESGIGDTTPVGKYSPQGDSFYGVADMAGNVWEWVNDWYDEEYYNNSPKENPQGPASGSSRVLRGGSWVNFDYFVRASDRSWSAPDDWDGSIGFRCARSVR